LAIASIRASRPQSFDHAKDIALPRFGALRPGYPLEIFATVAGRTTAEGGGNGGIRRQGTATISWEVIR
jgi:hypothetical protein